MNFKDIQEAVSVVSYYSLQVHVTLIIWIQRVQ